MNMVKVEFKRLWFQSHLSEQQTNDDIADAEARGYLAHVFVESVSGDMFPITFYDPIRLSQDLDEMANQGHPMIAEIGLIVLPKVTRQNMENAARRLVAEGYFSYMRSIARDDVALLDPYEWPPKVLDRRDIR